MWAFLALVFGLAIVGPTEVEPGDLAVFRFDGASGPVTWKVLPEEMAARFLEVVLPGGDRGLIFASSRPASVVIVAADCNDGAPRIVVHRFRNGSAPQPGPDPKPPRPEPPRPEPKPPYILLWIEESSERTVEQALAQNDVNIRRALQAAGWEFRVVDKDVKDERGQVPRELKAWIEVAIREGLPRLLAISKDGSYHSFSAPRNRGEFVTILGKLGLVVAAQSRTEGSRRPAPVYVGPCVGPYCPW
jgi:hypothetical protein